MRALLVHILVAPGGLCVSMVARVLALLSADGKCAISVAIKTHCNQGGGVRAWKSPYCSTAIGNACGRSARRVSLAKPRRTKQSTIFHYSGTNTKPGFARMIMVVFDCSPQRQPRSWWRRSRSYKQAVLPCALLRGPRSALRRLPSAGHRDLGHPPSFVFDGVRNDNRGFWLLT